MNIKPEQIRIYALADDSCELHWVGRGIGNSLQGWYPSAEDAISAVNVLIKLRLAEIS